jgi:hypothetical protein
MNMSISLAPIAIFAYKRKKELQASIESLMLCDRASETDVYLFSDGAKGEKDKEDVLAVREYVETIRGFRNFTYFFSETNRGLGASIIAGVTRVMEESPTIIVLEDDLLPSKNFLLYMNQGLQAYQDEPEVFSISGYNYPFKLKAGEQKDVYFLPRPCSYGWATWKDRWAKIDWNIKDFEQFSSNKVEVSRFNSGGSDLHRMLKRQRAGEIDSWAIRWAYNQYKSNSVTAYPMLSKIKNIGFSEQSTNTNIYDKYASPLDPGTKQQFDFPRDIGIDPFYHKQLLSFYSLPNRIKNRLLTYLLKFGFIK